MFITKNVGKLCTVYFVSFLFYQRTDKVPSHNGYLVEDHIQVIKTGIHPADLYLTTPNLPGCSGAIIAEPSVAGGRAPYSLSYKVNSEVGYVPAKVMRSRSPTEFWLVKSTKDKGTDPIGKVRDLMSPDCT